MEGHARDDQVFVAGNARQQFHDARGYGRPVGGNEIALSTVEAAYLLFRGDLDAVDGQGFRAFFTAATGDGFDCRFLVYKDLRDRGFYLAPDRADWVANPDNADFVVFERGQTPPDGAVAYRVTVVSERETVRVADLSDVLAVVDEESDITYFQVTDDAPTGDVDYTVPESLDGSLVADRAMVWEPPETLYDHGFFGRPLARRDQPTERATLQVSLVEAAYLAATGMLSLDHDRVLDRGRAVEGDRFDRRAQVYRALRDRGVVPKTGFKFGADFRTYGHVESVSSLGHSEFLVKVGPADHAISPVELAHDVRLTQGVRKQLVYALVDEDVEWVGVERLTP